MNDPNGLVSENGTYHLFFQQTPTAPVASIHGGHATGTFFLNQPLTSLTLQANGLTVPRRG